MGVDQAWQHDVAAAVDDLGIGRIEPRRDGDDLVAVDQHVARRQHAVRRVLRDDDAGAQQQRHVRARR
jgi:hypothetical protein